MEKERWVIHRLLLSVPLVLFLPIAFGIEGPLFSGPMADVVTFFVMLMIMKNVLKEFNTTIEKEGV